MREVPYVSEFSAKLVKEWEERFQRLPEEAGVLFVGIVPQPAPGGIAVAFEVTVGVTKERSDNLGVAIAKNVLEDVLERNRYTLIFKAVRGVACAAARPSGTRLHS